MRRLLPFFLLIAPAAFSQTVTWTNVHQTMAGFGSGQTFSQNYTPGSPVAISLNSAQLDSIYSPTVGMGYDWVRTGNWPDNTIHDLAILQGALTRGAKIAMSLQSPPTTLKASGVWNTGAYGPDGATCFSGTPSVSANMTTWGNDIVAILQQYTTAGVPISVLSMMTESNNTGGTDTFGQCDTTAAGMTTLIKTVVPIIKAGTGYPQPQIAMPETSGWFSPDYATNCLNDANCVNKVDIILSHNYSGNNPTWGPPSPAFCCAAPTLGPSAVQTFINAGHQLWMSETNSNNGSIAFDPSMTDALVWAHNAFGYLTIANVSYWQYWAQEWSGNFGYWKDDGTVTKRFYAIGNYAKFVQNGWVRIDASNPVSGVSITAFKDPVSGNFAIVVVNTNGATSSPTITLSGFPSITSNQVTPWLTDATHNIVAQTPIAASATIAPVLAASSVTTFVGSTSSSAPPWTGVIASNRAIDWRNDGLPGDQLPDGAWPVCATIAPYSGTDATITNALAACNTAHPTGGVVVLSAGTFTLSSGINFPSNTTGHLALRGQAANSTILQFTGNRCSLSAFANAFICVKSSDNSGIGSPTAPNWTQVTSGQTKGSTQLFLSSLNTAVVGSVLVLNQCNTGFTDTGLATACTGTSTDNGGYFVCSNYWTATGIGCGVQGEGSGDGVISWRSFASEMEGVVITAINAGGCGATCVTLSKPIEQPNWGNDTQAVIIQPLPYVGVENLMVNSTGVSSGVGIFLGNTLHAWVSGVSLINQATYGVTLYTSYGSLVKDSYFFGNPTNYGDHNAILTVAAANPLIQNNIFHAVQGGVFYGGTATPTQGGVISYNFTPVLGHGSCASAYMVDFHGAGQAYTLLEGNIGFGFDEDGDHGNHLSISTFRNLWTGWVSNGNGQCGTNFNIPGQNNGHNQNTERLYYGSRYSNIVFDRLGTPGYTTVYQSAGAFDDLRVYIMGAHQGSMPIDTLVASTSMRWGNWDTVNGSDQFNNSEVPTTTPNGNFLNNPIPSSHSGPPSFYLSSQPLWVSGSSWPLAGPDVTSGNVGICSGTLNASGKFNGVPATSPLQCAGSGLSSAWNNSVKANPAMAYYFQLGGLPDGSGPALTGFTAAFYYSGGSFPAVSLTPPSMSFTAIQNNTSSGQTATLTNTGTANLIVSNVVVSSFFSNTNTGTCAGTSFTLAPSASCTIIVTFSPNAPGPFSGTLSVSDNASGSPHIVSLSGTGTGSVIVWNPTSYAFGNQGVGLPVDSSTLVLSNTGNITLNVVLTITGTDASLFNISATTCGATLTAGNSCNVTVRFTPVAVGSFSANLVETDVSQSISGSVALTGSGVTTTIVSAPCPWCQ